MAYALALTHVHRLPAYMAPTWRDGGLYYPRNDAETNADGNRTIVEPLTGNVLLGYARLNVPDGLRRLYNEPWDRAHFDEPAITAVARDVEVSEAFFDRSRRTLTFTVRRSDDRAGDGVVGLRDAPGTAAWSVDGAERVVPRSAPQDLGGGFVLSRDGEELLLRCPPGGFHTIVMTLP
jgi:hypothetical protein